MWDGGCGIFLPRRGAINSECGLGIWDLGLGILDCPEGMPLVSDVTMINVP